MLTRTVSFNQRMKLLSFAASIILLTLTLVYFAFAPQENERLPDNVGQPHTIPELENVTDQELPNATTPGNAEEKAIEVIRATEDVEIMMPPTLQERLQKKITFFAQDEGLKECILKLKKESQIEMSIIVDESYDSDKKYTLQKDENTVGNILNQLMILSGLHWTYNDKGDVQIYSHKTAPVTTRTYLIKPLLNKQDGLFQYDDDPDYVLEFIKKYSEPEPWENNGFDIQPFLGDRLIITANAYTHRMVEDICNALLELNGRIATGKVKESIAIGEGWRNDMITTLSQDINLPKADLSLTECVVLLRNSLSLNVWVDVASLQKGALEKVTCDQPLVSARTLLIKICEKNELVYNFIKNTIVITSPNSTLALINDMRLYDVRDLIDENNSIRELFEFTKSTTAADIWSQDRASMETLGDNILFISVYDKTHQQIENAFKRIRTVF